MRTSACVVVEAYDRLEKKVSTNMTLARWLALRDALGTGCEVVRQAAAIFIIDNKEELKALAQALSFIEGFQDEQPSKETR